MMDFPELDRDVLLQEIQQIQQTIEASGRNFETYSSNDDDDSDDDNEIYNEEVNGENGSNVWNVCQNEEEDEGDLKINLNQCFYKIVDDNQALVVTPPTDHLFEAPSDNGNLNATNIITEASRILSNDSHLKRKTPESVDSPENLASPVSPPSVYSSHFSSRINSPFLSGTATPIENGKFIGKKATDKVQGDTLRKRRTRRGGRIAQLRNTDGMSSVDVSIPNSMKSLPEKKKEQINITNLYVERIFRSYRDKGSSKSFSSTFPGLKYDSRNLSCSASLKSLENLLQVNKRYQALLQEELKNIHLALSRNRRAQDEFDFSKNSSEVTFANLARATMGKFTKPYFKDNSGFGPPDNEDTKEKKITLRVNPSTKVSKPWKASEYANLHEGVYHNNLELRLKPLLHRLKAVDKDIKEKVRQGAVKVNRNEFHRLSKEIKEIKELPKDDLLKDATEIDFFKISKNYIADREEFDCRLQWLHVAHPLVNQSKFTKEEDSKILKLAKVFRNFEWEAIAKELGSNRSPVQCLQRYQRSLNKDMMKNTWNAYDDEQLTKGVKLYGNDWIAIADYMGDRTSNQCLNRWEKTLNPSIKRGKWSAEEDEALIAAVEKFGLKNWKRVKFEVPGRTDSQCRERYVSSLDEKKNLSKFSQEEDQKIIEMVAKYGTGKWSKIATEFPDRHDNQIWRRYKQIQAESYHKYRRDVIWKRNSVMTYFLHRKHEKRDYELEELEVTYSPNVSAIEAKRVERFHEKLREEGLSEEEITRTLARLHYEGHFSDSRTKRRQFVRRKIRKKKEKDKTIDVENTISEENNIDEGNNDTTIVKSEPPEPDMDNESTPSMVKDRVRFNRPIDHQLMNKITETIANSENPDNDLPNIEKLEIYKLKQQERFDPEEYWNNECRGKCECILEDYDAGKISYEEAKKSFSTLCWITDTENENENNRIPRRLKRNIVKYIEKLEEKHRNEELSDNGEGTITKQGRLKRTNELVEGGAGSKRRKTCPPKKIVQSVYDIKSEVASDGDEQTSSLIEETSNELDKRLQTFTLLLQALHIDTASVMRSLPQENIVDDVNTPDDNNDDSSFPVCFPISPNIASLQGFRTMLLHRRMLSAMINSSDGLSVTARDTSYRKTKSYDKLLKRFRSTFIWPAFLATFVPKYVTDDENS